MNNRVFELYVMQDQNISQYGKLREVFQRWKEQILQLVELDQRYDCGTLRHQAEESEEDLQRYFHLVFRVHRYYEELLRQMTGEPFSRSTGELVILERRIQEQQEKLLKDVEEIKRQTYGISPQLCELVERIDREVQEWIYNTKDSLQRLRMIQQETEEIRMSFQRPNYASSPPSRKREASPSPEPYEAPEKVSKEAKHWYKRAGDSGESLVKRIGALFRPGREKKKMPEQMRKPEDMSGSVNSEKKVCADGTGINVSSIPEKPSVDQVVFSAIAPKSFLRGDYNQFSLVMYEEAWRDVVNRIRNSLDASSGETSSGVLEAEKGTKVTLLLSSREAGVEFEENRLEGIWRGKYLEFQALVLISEDYNKQRIPLRVDVYFNGVPATQLLFTVNAVNGTDAPLEPERRDIRSAFMSYASQDRARVAMIVQGLEKARPDLKVFFDVESLRSGQKWEEQIRQELMDCDLLYLCWSDWAKKSRWVEYEWRYMLEKRGVERIEPIPLVSPEVCPPPRELESKHFNDRMLLYWNKN